jgi:hypothetical protein
MIQAISGVRSASAVLALPLAAHVLHPSNSRSSFASLQPAPGDLLQSITPDYFQTMGTRLVRGRFFTDRDNKTARVLRSSMNPSPGACGAIRIHWARTLWGARGVGR